MRGSGRNQGRQAPDRGTGRSVSRVLCKKVLRRPGKWPLDRFSVIQPAWAGETVICIAGGPSVTADQCAAAAAAQAAGRARVIAINDAYKIAPTADVLYFADSRWWEWHKDRPQFKEFAGLKCSIENTGAMVTDDAVHMLRNAANMPHGRHLQGDGVIGGLSSWPNALRTGMNGGYQALGLAIAAGAARVVLVGYDMSFAPGKTHWHAGHPEVMASDDMYRTVYRKFFEDLKLPEGVTVLNASPVSTIKAFPKMMSVEDALHQHTKEEIAP